MIDSTSVAPNRVTLATGQLTAQIKMDTDTIRIDNLASTQPSQINMDAAGAIQIYATDLLLPNVISGVSTINGAAYPPAAFIPADITVSTLTAATYVSTLAVSGGAGVLDITAGNTLTIDTQDELHLKGINIQVGVGGGSTDINLNGNTIVNGTLGLPTQALQVSSITGVSSINGAVYPPAAVLPASANFSTLGIGAGWQHHSGRFSSLS